MTGKVQIFDEQGDLLILSPGGGIMVGASNSNSIANIIAGQATPALAVCTGTSSALTALNGVTVNTPGPSLDFGAGRRTFSMVVTATGAPTGGTVALEVSVDGVTFVASGVTAAVGASPSTASLTGVAFRYARANMSGLAGGTSPAVTAKIMTS